MTVEAQTKTPAIAGEVERSVRAFSSVARLATPPALMGSGTMRTGARQRSRCDRPLRRTRSSPFAVAYRALVAKGKPKKLALVATMRKLLVTLNAIAKHNTPWREQPLKAAA